MDNVQAQDEYCKIAVVHMICDSEKVVFVKIAEARQELMVGFMVNVSTNVVEGSWSNPVSDVKQQLTRSNERQSK